MALPGDVEKVTISTGGVPITLPDGTPLSGKILFTGPDLVTIGGQDMVLGGTVEVTLIDGNFSVILVATNATGMDPQNWTYKVRTMFDNAPNWERYVLLPKEQPNVVIADVLIPDPANAQYALIFNSETLLVKSENLADVPDKATARANLGLTAAASAAFGTTAGTIAAGDDARITGALQAANNFSDITNLAEARQNLGILDVTSALMSYNNLSEIQDDAAARTNLGLGDAATRNVGTTAGTVMAGDDARVGGALLIQNNLSDLTNIQTAHINLALGDAATKNIGTTANTVMAGNDTRVTGALQASSNLSDLANPSTARTSLGLGGAALLNVGTTSSTVAAGDAPAAALSSAQQDATNKVQAHTEAVDPHGDRAWASQTFATESDVTRVRTQWRRRDLPDPADVDSLHTGTAPTIGTTQTTTPTAGYIKYSPAPVALAGSDVRGPFTWAGAGDFAIGATAPDTNYVLPLSRYPNTYASGQSTWSVEFGTDAQTIQVRFKYISAATMYRLSINGRKVTDLMQSSGGITPGSGHMLTIDFGSATPRRIRLDFTTFPFGGVYVPPTASLWGVPTRSDRLMVLGDSISDGSSQNTGAAAGTWVDRFGRLFGSTDVWRQGRGGTGYITPGSHVTFGDRVNTDVIAWNPDRLIIWGGYNDNGGSQSAIAAAADALYTAVRQGLPECEVYVIGCWAPTGSPTSGIVNTDETLRTAAAAAGFPFVSPVTGNCYDADGNLVASHGVWITSGNASTYIGADNVHPNDAGHVYLSRRIAAAIGALLPA